jgi:S1-C subfamily serine protease
MADEKTRTLYVLILVLALFAAGASGAAAVLWVQARDAQRPAPAAVALEPAADVPAIQASPAAPPAIAVAAAASVAVPASAVAVVATEDVIARSLRAVVLVEGKGSAFFVAKDRLITNHHVVKGNSYATLKTQDGGSMTRP